MKVELVFEDWMKKGTVGSIYNTDLGLELSSGDFHSGTVFHAELNLEGPGGAGDEQEIKEALFKHGAYPVFRVLVKEEKGGLRER